jgi:hypothetical protein
LLAIVSGLPSGVTSVGLAFLQIALSVILTAFWLILIKYSGAGKVRTDKFLKQGF